ncbi:importin beta-4 subunit [Coprinopsis cinerea okayama7|uniref:Importin beta-4 subunit n=1 Tax=Coprinopsis cinerea (strain Okayama-7 / 130 / ATCC MYA-4618 / FGSC 9003) TaxID=240176 RepID=A8N951_COPC7|nr:importin beta-4 subunit [Coprinopsis cinerea okayama7\|eukprot:XP_001831379.2 importin beta-4 subunit [Coprinopsis cinerea okayama7\
MDQASLQKLHDLLLQTTSNDTALVRAATAQLNQDFYKHPLCISGLTTILATSPQEPVRQLAAVELRKRVSQNSGNLWTQLDQSIREQIKQDLPKLILEEKNKLARHSAARVIAAIASIEVPAGTWSNLLPLLESACQSSEAGHREVGSFILYTVLENIVEGFQEYLPKLFSLFEALLQDPSIEVRITIVRALGVIAQYIDNDDKALLRAYQNLVPAMINVIGQTVEANDETGARQLFDVLETLLILEIPVLGRHVPELAAFLLQCGGNVNFDPELRVLALNALNWTVQYKKSKIQSNNLAPQILEGLMPITTEAEPEDIDDDAPSRSALRIVDGLATNLPPDQVFPPLRNLILKFFQSADPAHRRGAMLALGVSVEGCSEFMTPLMGHVWPFIEAGLQDGDAGVRKATCIAVSCLCEWLEDECVSKHEALMPAIMNLINDPTTQKSACTALDALLEILHDHIDQYLQMIMERLAGLLQTAPISVKAVVTGAIGSAAHASKERFLPYFEQTIKILASFLTLTEEGEEIELRGITMDAIGTFAEAVGADQFRPYFADMMGCAFKGLEMGSARLRECSFLFFGVMARVFGEEFAPYLPQVVPALLTSCKQLEQGEEELSLSIAEAAQAFTSGSSATEPINVNTELDINGNTSIELEDLDVEKMMDVNSALAVEKEIAADTMGTFLVSTGGHFLPLVEESTIVKTFYELSDHKEWVPGMKVVHPVSPQVKELIEHVIEPLMEMYDTEDNKNVVSALCVGFADAINKIGPAFIEGRIEPICNIAIEILEQKALCQQDPDQDEDDEAPEYQAEYDSVLISSAGDLVAALANALGVEFVPAFNTFYPLIAKYYRKNRSLSDRSSAIGCFAEIISGIKNGVTEHTAALLELFQKALNDEEPEVLSNAAFAIGLLVEYSEHDLSSQYLPILGHLRPLFEVPADAPSTRLNAKDNATGAVARIITRNAAALPLDQVLPIFLSALPLKTDLLENRPVFRAFFHLFNTNGAALLPYMDTILSVFAYVLDPSKPDQVGDEVRAELLQLLRAINAEAPEKIQAAGLAVYV